MPIAKTTYYIRSQLELIKRAIRHFNFHDNFQLLKFYLILSFVIPVNYNRLQFLEYFMILYNNVLANKDF